MAEFFARGKMIKDEPLDVAEDRKKTSDRDFAKRAIAELIGIRHAHTELMVRVEILQDEIRKRILKIEAPPPAAAKKKPKPRPTRCEGT